MEEIVPKVLSKYRISFTRILPAQKGYRNTSFPVELEDGSVINLIVYKREPGIAERIGNADSLSAFINSRGYPSRHPLGKVVRLADTNNTRFAQIYNYLPGQTISWEAYTMRHIKLLGKTLSDMHYTLRDYPDGKSLPDIQALNEGLLDHMGHYFNSTDVRRAMLEKLGLQITTVTFSFLEKVLASANRLGGKQALHMDFVRGNVLFSSEKENAYRSLGDDKPPYLTGILDFEKTAYGNRIFEVARTLAFLLVDCKYKPSDKVKKYFIDSGYTKRGKSALSPEQLRSLSPLIDFYLLHDLYKFLRHNPYESLPENEHFLRTRDFLLKNGIIRQTS